MPSHAHPLSGLPLRDAGSDRINPSADLMSGRSRELQARIQGFLDQGVAVTDAASFDLDANLARSGLADIPLDNLERSTGLCYLRNSHTSPVYSPLKLWK
jgi:hypothetical protein